MRVPLAAHIENPPRAQETADLQRARLIVRGLGQHESAVHAAILRSSLLPVIAPVGIAVPVDEAHERWIDLVHEAPDPVKPERVEALDGGPPNESGTTGEIRIEPATHPVRDLLVDRAIALEAEPPSDPGAVGFVPHAPIPVPHRLAAPLFDAPPDDVGAPGGEPADGSRVVVRLTERCEGDHGRGADLEHGLDIGRESGPVPYGIGRALVECEDSDDPRSELADSRPETFPCGGEGEVPPAVGL